MDIELIAGVAVGFWAAHQVNKAYQNVSDEVEQYKEQVQELLAQVQEQRQALLQSGAEFLTSDEASIVGPPEQTGAESPMQGHSYMGRSNFLQQHRASMGFIPYPAHYGYGGR
jgi:hypothetical protein